MKAKMKNDKIYEKVKERGLATENKKYKDNRNARNNN